MRTVLLVCGAAFAWGCSRQQPPPERPDPGDRLVLAASPRKSGKIGPLGRPQLTAVDGWPSSVEAGDLDGDKIPDLLVLAHVSVDGKGMSQMEAWLGDGKGGFTRAGGFVIGEFVVMVDTADFDGDGTLDVVVPRHREKELAVHRGRGDGTFEKATITKTTRKASLLTATEVNGDERPDVVVSYFNYLQVFLGDGRGGFKALTPWQPGQAPEFPVLADLDGDGDRDLYIVLNDESKFLTYENAGDGTFASWFSGSSCDSPSYPHGADFDGDGTTDLAYTCGNASDSGIEVRLARHKGSEFITVAVAAHPIEMLEVGDFTGDGAPDIISMGRGGSGYISTVQLHAGDGEGAFITACEGSGGATLTDPITLDADGDGIMDFATAYWSGREPGHVAVWRSPCAAD